MRKKIINCLNHELAGLYRHSAKLKALEDAIKKYLPKHLATIIQLASYEKGVLVIAMKDQAASTELRYKLPDLRDELRNKESLYTLRTIKIIQSI